MCMIRKLNQKPNTTIFAFESEFHFQITAELTFESEFHFQITLNMSFESEFHFQMSVPPWFESEFHFQMTNSLTFESEIQFQMTYPVLFESEIHFQMQNQKYRTQPCYAGVAVIRIKTQWKNHIYGSKTESQLLNTTVEKPS